MINDVYILCCLVVFGLRKGFPFQLNYFTALMRIASCYVIMVWVHVHGVNMDD
jgi:hypothetical protein